VVFIIWRRWPRRDALVVGIFFLSILALGAVVLTLIYCVLKFVHFAHGYAMMMSSYVAFFFLFGHIVGARPSDDVSILPFTVTDLPGADQTIWRFSFGYGLLVDIVLSAAVMAALFIGIDRVIYRKLRQRKSGIVIFSIAALGLARSLCVASYCWFTARTRGSTHRASASASICRLTYTSWPTSFSSSAPRSR
jgi:branched-chain amino acid transport system permease protein/neutral amino acid transport system permease protein